MKREVLYLSSPPERIRAVKHLIASAKENIVLQMYLFAASGELSTLRPVDSLPWARTVAGWLIKRKRECPKLQIIVLLDTQTIEDPGKTRAAGPLTRHILESEGITVLHASLARTVYNRKRRFPAACRFHETWENGTGPVSKSRWAALQNRWQILHNVEDHRKNIVIDSGRAGLVLSHNIIDQARLWQENSFLLRGDPARRLFKTALQSVEDALALPLQFSLQDVQTLDFVSQEKRKLNPEEAVPAEALTEVLDGGPVIREAMARELSRLETDEVTEIRAASAYFSDLPLLQALQKAGRKADVRILIDNCHALSLAWPLRFLLRNTVNLLCIHECRKGGGASLRVFESNPLEMMHCKAVLFSGTPSCLIAGQANFTPNSFSGAWLETDVRTTDPAAIQKFTRHFDELWSRARQIEPYNRMRPAERFWAKAHAFSFLFLLRIFGWLGFRY